MWKRKVIDYESEFGKLILETVQYYSRRKTVSKTHEEILANRGPIYGEALINLACTQELCNVFDRYYFKNKTTDAKRIEDNQYNAQQAAIHLALTKIARIATGAFHEDNYLDGSNYIEIARKIMKGESTLCQKSDATSVES